MNVRNWFPARSFLLLAALCLALGASGCSVLTPSQVKEVNRFARAVKSYDTLPGAVTEAHAELRKREKIYSAAGFIPGVMALPQIESALEAQREAQKKARQVDKALDILDEYAQLLVTLTSDDFSEDLQEEAEDLGKRIDKGIKVYNEEFGKEIKAYGGILSAGIRGAGGIFIKRRQTIALRETVTNADPVIEEMTTAVNDLLDLYLPSEAGEGFIRETEITLKGLFKEDIQGSMAKEPLFVAMQTAETLEYSHDALKLAEQARQSISKLRQAHLELKNSLQKKGKLKGAIETVKVFADEVKVANDLKKKIEKG